MELAGWGSKKDLGGAEGEESKIRIYFVKNCSIIKERNETIVQSERRLMMPANTGG